MTRSYCRATVIVRKKTAVVLAPLVTDQGLRTRVERLLRNEVHGYDISRLFLYARDRCDGRETVQEIGDFVAHHDERTKGLITDTARDWATIVKFHSRPLATKQPYQWHSLPADFPEALRATRRRLGYTGTRAQTGVSHAIVAKEVLAIISSLIANADGTYTIPATLSARQKNIVDTLTSVMVIKSAFSGERLFRDFVETLRSNGILHKNEMHEFSQIRSSIILYAVTVMNNCVIRLTDGENCRLRAEFAGEINVSASIPVDFGDGRKINISSSMFSTDLEASMYASQDVLSGTHPNYDLELTDNNKLSYLR